MNKLFSFDIKLERAKRHILDFEHAQEIFMRDDPYAAVHYSDVDSRDYIVELRVFEDCPDELLAIAGDALHNLRSALDHLVYSIELANRRTPDKRTQFVIYDTIDAFNNARREREVRYGTDFARLIEEMKPYRGEHDVGEDSLVALHDLDIIDKHRLLVTTAASNTGVHAISMVNLQDFGPKRLFGQRITLPAFGPMKSGDELLRIPFDRASNVQVNFTFQIALGDIWEGRMVRGSLHMLLDFVARTLENFRPLL